MYNEEYKIEGDFVNINGVRVPNVNNYSSGPLAAVDSLNRALPTVEQSKPLRKDRFVGMFYFLWIGEEGTKGPYDVSKILAKDLQAGYKPEDPMWGPWGTYHHWGESFFGYYFSNDAWVVRRHVEMLTLADVDFLVFDTTNGPTYEKNAKLVMSVLNEYRESGWKTPQVVFYTNTNSGETAKAIYNAIYKKNYMPDTWFRVDGKPLIIGDSKSFPKEVKDFFTVRETQWPNEGTKLNSFPWMDFTRPQRVFCDLNGKPQVVNVSIAQHPQIRFGDSAMYGETQNRGRSFHNGKEDKSPNAYLYGYNFQEQWDRALEADTPYVFVTGWNEWIMGKWHSDNPSRPILFVDAANTEYSRDIEPMRGGYFDNYYMQLIQNVRRFKGTIPVPKQSEKVSIDVAGDFTQWNKVKVEYRDFSGETEPRDARGFGQVYANKTGRNEICAAKAAQDDANVYFYVSTASPITPRDDSDWMKLYINISGKDGARWNGYDFAANYSQVTDGKGSPATGKTTVAKCAGDFNWQVAAEIRYRVEGNQLMLEIPKSVLGLQPDEKFSLQFKWVDCQEKLASIEDFYEKGDTAPFGRFNYIFEN